MSALATRPHPVQIGAPRHVQPGAAPLLLQREDDDFINAVVQDLAASGGSGRLLASRAQARSGQRLKLFQPVQRRFHVALLEAWCETPGRPRIDPARVAAAGLVVRRVRDGVVEGWMRGGGKVRGWLPVSRIGGDQADPAPAPRRALRDTGVASIDQALRRLRATEDASVLEEDVVPMFIAPPEVCARAGKTVYYGVVPTASGERADTAQDLARLFEGFDATSSAFIGHLVQPLRGLAWTPPSPPLAGRSFDRSWYDTLRAAVAGSDARRFLDLLQQVVVEFDAFGAGSGPLRAQLAAIRLPCQPLPGQPSRSVDAASFLEAATRVLLDDQPGQVEMPLSWPALGTPQARQLHQAMHAAMLARFGQVGGRPGRFDDAGAEYVVSAFLRLKPDCGCAGRTVWSQPTERFVIAPWYEGGGDPVKIELPDLADRTQLRQLKPNVSFAMPASLQNLLAGDASKLLDGERGNGGFTVGWICSFSIPVITFCAFIVLNIFLSLFDLFFRWMMFIKVCIPYPKKAG